jgi:hypothetical protein
MLMSIFTMAILPARTARTFWAWPAFAFAILRTLARFCVRRRAIKLATRTSAIRSTLVARRTAIASAALLSIFAVVLRETFTGRGLVDPRGKYFQID